MLLTGKDVCSAMQEFIMILLVVLCRIFCLINFSIPANCQTIVWLKPKRK